MRNYSRMHPAATLLAFMTVFSITLLGQASFFKTVSIKFIDAEGAKANMLPAPTQWGDLYAPSVTAAALIRSAYGEGPAESAVEFVGAPAWVATDRFSIIATGAGRLSPWDARPLMQRLLVDHFHLVLHIEVSEQPAYALVKSSPDGQLGPAIQTSPVDCQAMADAWRGGLRYDPPPSSNGAPPCGFRGAGGQYVAAGVPLQSFAVMLSRTVGRPILDETRLSGVFEFTFKWTGLGTAKPPLRDDQFDALSDALRTQLGFTLVPAKAPLQKLVIDSIERPTDN